MSIIDTRISDSRYPSVIGALCYTICQARNGMLSLEQLRWAAVGWVGGAFCVASYVHGHHSVWVTDAWRVLQAICQGEI